MIVLSGYQSADQPMLPMFASAGIKQMRKRHLGRLGEATVSHELIRAGYVVKQARVQHGDLLAIDPDGGQAVKIEVKTARADCEGRYQFCLRRVLDRVCTDFQHADIVVLLAVQEDATCTAFVVPTSAIAAGQMKIVIRDTTRGKYSAYQRNSITLEGI